MKILKLLNKIIFIVTITYLLSFLQVLAEDKPIDIWNLENKDDKEVVIENSISTKTLETSEQNSVYKLQENKVKESIELDEKLLSTDIKIVGLYDPDDYGLSMDMWLNSDGLDLKSLFKNLENFELSKDASEIMQVSLLTNAYYPNENITEQNLWSNCAILKIWRDQLEL